MNDSTFSEFSAQDTKLAALEAQEWIEAVVEKKFAKTSFRVSLEDGVLLCQLMNKIDPGSIRRINKSKSPIAYLDNIQQFLHRCQYLGMKDAQLFDTMDLQEIKSIRKVGVKRDETDRRIRAVCVTLYWLGRTVAEMENYSGPQLDLNLFKRLMEGNLSEDEDEEDNEINHDGDSMTEQLNRLPEPDKVPQIKPPVTNGNTADKPALTFEQEQTADELLADIQNAVDEMLQDFQTSPVAANPPLVAPKTKRDKPSKKFQPAQFTEHSIHIQSKNGGFGFQVMGGVGSDIPAEVDYIVPSSSAADSGLQVGDLMVTVNGDNIKRLSHINLVTVIKKAGQTGEVTLGVLRKNPDGDSTSHTSPSGSNQTDFSSFSRRESREKWEDENEERERQAKEIALMYPQRNGGPHLMENTLGTGPPPTFGKKTLPPLVEHQEEAIFEEIQEMLDSVDIPSPPASPISPSPLQAPPSVLSSSQTSSQAMSPLTISPTNQLPNDKETLEREIQELTLMEAAAKRDSEVFDFSDSASESEVAMVDPGRDEENIFSLGKGQVDVEQHERPREKNNSVAIKVDSFRVEESSSPLPLSPIAEVSSDSEVQQTNNLVTFPEQITPTPPTSPAESEDPMETLDRELLDLLNFSESRKKGAEVPPAKAQTPPRDSWETHFSEVVVTPPPMFNSPPPPKPTSAAPKRVVKRPAPPPPPKPKPKPNTFSFTESDAVHLENIEDVEVAGIEVADIEAADIEAADAVVNVPAVPSPSSPSSPSDIEEIFQSKPFERSTSPDLVTQMMQELSYSKSMNVTTPQPIQESMMSANLPKPNGLQTQQYSSPPQSLAISSSGSTSTTKPTTPQSTTPQIVEVLGDIKIHRVLKTRWTPKGSIADPSPTQTPEQQPMPASQHSNNKSSTLPANKAYLRNGAAASHTSPSKRSDNGYNTSNKGNQGFGISAVVVARGIGSRAGGIGTGQNQNRFSQPIPVKGNLYLPLQQRQQNGDSAKVPWKSQEELRVHSTQQSVGHTQRHATTPDGTRDYRVQKTMSLPRGNKKDWRNDRSNTWASRSNGKPSDGYQVAYVMQAGSPHDLCSRCHQPLGQGTVMSVPATKTQYHIKCFVCRVCRGVVADGRQNTTVMMKNMQPHCRFCASGENGTQTTEC